MPKQPKKIRLPLEMSPDFHRDLKVHAALAGECLKDYIFRAIAARQQREQLLVKHIDRPISED